MMRTRSRNDSHKHHKQVGSHREAHTPPFTHPPNHPTNGVDAVSSSSPSLSPAFLERVVGRTAWFNLDDQATKDGFCSARSG